MCFAIRVESRELDGTAAPTFANDGCPHFVNKDGGRYQAADVNII